LLVMDVLRFDNLPVDCWGSAAFVCPLEHIGVRVCTVVFSL